MVVSNFGIKIAYGTGSSMMVDPIDWIFPKLRSVGPTAMVGAGP